MPDSNNPFLIPPPPPGMPQAPAKPIDTAPSRAASPIVVPPVSPASGAAPLTAATESNGVVFFATIPGATAATSASWHLVLDDGSSMPIAKAVFIGRDPARTPDRPGADLRSIDDPARSLSKTHALLELDAGSLWVHDLHSTNGVVVAAPGEPPIVVEPGARASLAPDAEVRLGSYVIRVRRT